MITSDARSFAEEVSHGNGMIYSQGDVEGLANALTHVCATPDLVVQWAEKALDMGRSRVWSLTAERFRDVFRQACEVK